MESKNEITKAIMDVEYCPPDKLMQMNINLDKSEKFSISQLASLGVAFEPLTQLANFAISGAGQSGLYFVNTYGKTMFKSGTEYIGNLMSANGGVGGGIARLTQLPFNPTMLCMSIVLMNVEKKLNVIADTQRDILAFLEMKEEAKLKGNLNTLSDILNNYKYNWDNEKYKDHKHILVQDIKREAEQSIIFYREHLMKKIDKKAFLHNSQEVKSTMNKIVSLFNDYQLSLYIFSFSSFLEIMLIENFDTDFLNNIVEKINNYSDDYFSLYGECSEKLENDSKHSLEGYALKGLSKISGGAGKLIEKIPVISKSQLDENLIKAGDKLQMTNENRTQKVLKNLADSQTDYTSPFVSNIMTIDKLYNNHVKLMFDSENVYLSSD